MNMIANRMENRGQGGFTLIELLVVVAILAVLSGAAIIGIGAMRTNATDTVCESDQDTLATAAEAALIDNPGLTLTADDGSGLGALIKRVPTSGATVTVAAGVVTTGGC